MIPIHTFFAAQGYVDLINKGFTEWPENWGIHELRTHLTCCLY